LKKEVPSRISAKRLDKNINYDVKPKGKFVTVASQSTGNDRSQTYVDTYGGWAAHGGALSPEKIDESGSLRLHMDSYIAKNIGAAGLTDRGNVQLAYAIV